jgi:hypothetical protein
MNPITRRRQFAPRLYLLNDGFHDILAAGAVNGTYSTPPHNVRVLGDGKRTVVDTENKLSISGGKLVFAGGKAAPDWGDPGLWYPVETRAAGKVLLLSVSNINTAGAPVLFGWDTDQSGLIEYGFFFQPSNIYRLESGANLVIGDFAASTAYQLALVLRAQGVDYFVKGGAFTYWTLLWHGGNGNVSPVYPGISNYNAAFSADEPRVAKRRWLPEPIAYDAFTRADGPIGVSDAIGPDGQSCISRAWSFPAGTAAISGNAAVISPTAGAELVTNGNMELDSDWLSNGTVITNERSNTQAHGGTYSRKIVIDAQWEGIVQVVTPIVGTWYFYSAWVYGDGAVDIATSVDFLNSLALIDAPASWTRLFMVSRCGTAGANNLYVRAQSADAATFYADDVQLLPLTLASLFSSVTDAKTSDVLVDVKVLSLVSGTQAGLVARLDSASSPANFVLAYFDGAGNIKCDEVVAGVYTNLISAASVYAANATLRLDVSGTAVRLYTITSAGVAVLVGTATTNVATGTKHGIFSTYNLNSFSQIQIFPKGTSGELNALDSL